jgi:hypothetical protein
MSDRYFGQETRKRRTERARSVTLHDKKVGPRRQPRKQLRGHRLHMPVRILVARTAEMDGGVVLDAEFHRIKCWVLIGEHKRRRQPAIAERMGDWCHFDRFRPGADDQPDIGEFQSSP